MTLDIYAASAGTGKTTKLAELMEEALLGRGVAPCRPEGIIATTFTRQAAAELRERTRTQLLSNGHVEAAHALHAAMIGTVNSVCGRIVSDFAFELGLSPELRVLDEAEASQALAYCLSKHEHAEASDALFKLARTMEALVDAKSVLHWQTGVRQIVQLARLNGLDAHALEESRLRSTESLLALFGEPASDGAALDRNLRAALETFDREVDTDVHKAQKTAAAMDKVRSALQIFARNSRPPWSAWVGLATLDAGAKLRDVAAPVIEAAARHDNHPELRRELTRAVELIFGVAARALDDYQAHKRARGVIDFVDQEVLALAALDNPAVREELRHRLDLVMVDEFQDTSPLQLAIFLKLFELAPRSIWVGDQKQAIYSFRGTDPALMSAAIEQLEDAGDDGSAELVERTLADVSRRAKVSVLQHSWRSRPPLVNLTSELFARSFEPHGIPPERTRITAGHPNDDPSLGPCVEYWALNIESNPRTSDLPRVLAAGVKEALEDPSVRVRDRLSGEPRHLRPEDIGILCRSNSQCQNASAALTALGIAVQMPRAGLLATLEGSAVVAALHLWRAPRTALFVAQLSRILGERADPQAWTNAALDAPYAKELATESVIVALSDASAAHADADPVTAMDMVMEATGIRERCLEWGNAAQRLANLDMLRSYAAAYATTASARGDACTVAGLLYRFETLAAEGQDACALLEQEGAVAVSTWHAAKGLEWPMVILFGLERKRDRTTRFYGARAETPAGAIDLEAPLSGRWIRYWCTPYLGANTRTPFNARLQEHPLAQNADMQQDREELRLLYVGWTRARDRLVLACHQYDDHFIEGMHRHLRDTAGLLISPPEGKTVRWADREVTLAYRDLQIEEGEAAPAQPGEGYEKPVRSAVAHAPARARPSAKQERGNILEVHTLGERILLTRDDVDANALGQAMHAFLAADRREYTSAVRQSIAQALLQGWAVDTHIGPAALIEASARLRAWVDRSWRVETWLPEVPMHYRDPAGTRIGGRADLVLALEEGGWILIDHKTFTRTVDEVKESARSYAGQLAAYSAAIRAATAHPVRGMYVHVPLAGALIQLG